MSQQALALARRSRRLLAPVALAQQPTTSVSTPHFCAQIVAEFARHAPIERLRCHGRPWEGLLSMEVRAGRPVAACPKLIFAKLSGGKLEQH